MKRKEQMMNAAEAYAAGLYADEPVSFSTEESMCETMNDFCAGWRTADRCPQWIPVEKELPKPNIYKEGKTFPLVLVCLNDGCCEDTDAYDTDNKTWCKYEDEVEYWMPLPIPPAPRKEE
jgi:hypothetical protein